MKSTHTPFREWIQPVCTVVMFFVFFATLIRESGGDNATLRHQVHLNTEDIAAIKTIVGEDHDKITRLEANVEWLVRRNGGDPEIIGSVKSHK